ncbi:hypothetical protein GQ600_284 [Phytophthora cactorum]|nr:hypothetical protein GQ600_284 [Phytophthora cactorum]
MRGRRYRQPRSFVHPVARSLSRAITFIRQSTEWGYGLCGEGLQKIIVASTSVGDTEDLTISLGWLTFAYGLWESVKSAPRTCTLQQANDNVIKYVLILITLSLCRTI